tara:strand:- start:655 stop:1044 length:390 start_codon:yes stop_codon:yes gene_type:complete
MAITLAYEESPSSTFSDSGNFTSPVCLTFDGIGGETIIKKLLITNTDQTNTLENIEIGISPPEGITYSFLTVKLREADVGSFADSPLTLAGTLSPQTDATFWIELKVAEASAVQNIKDLNFAITWNIQA